MAALAATAGPVCISNNRRLNAQRTACNTLSCRTRAAAVDRPSTDKRHVLQLNPADIQPVQCLKEWAVTCAALGAGQQTVLVRKGGIREPTFTPKATRFLLFPTAFHADPHLLKPGVAEQFQRDMVLQSKEVEQLPLQYYAEVTGAWTTKDPQVLNVLEPLHVYAEGFLETRLKWRAKEPLTLLELRCYRLQQPLLLPVKQREQYFGCFSWVQLEAADVVPVGAAEKGPNVWELEAALTDDEFVQRQGVLRAGLQQLQVEQLEILTGLA